MLVFGLITAIKVWKLVEKWQWIKNEIELSFSVVGENIILKTVVVLLCDDGISQEKNECLRSQTTIS